MKMRIPAELRTRLRKLQEALAAADLHGYVAVTRGSLNYLIGAYTPWRSALVVPAQGENFVGVFWAGDLARIRRETWISNLSVHPCKGENFAASVSEVVKSTLPAGARIGMEISSPSGRITPGVLDACEWIDFQKGLAGFELVNAYELIENIMQLKSEDEIQILTEATRIADAGITAALDTLRPGITETELLGTAELEVRKNGCEHYWSVTGNEIGSGCRTYYGGGPPPSRKVIQTGEMVMLDLHVMYKMYYTDLSINAIVGEPSKRQLKLAETAVKAYDLLIQSLVPGRTFHSIASEVNSFVEACGLGEHHRKFLGHGIGTCGQAPLLMVGNDKPVALNMVLVPGIMIYQPGVGGMKIEAPAHIAQTGAVPLSRIPVKLHSAKTLMADGQ